MIFRLDSLLSLRANQEKLEQQGLSKIQAILLGHQKEIKIIDSRRHQNKESLKQKWGQPIQPETLILYDNFEKGLRANQEKQESALAQVEEKAVAKRVELTEAMRKRRMLETLKEIESLRHKSKERKAETAFLDEVASNQWLRRSQ